MELCCQSFMPAVLAALGAGPVVFGSVPVARYGRTIAEVGCGVANVQRTWVEVFKHNQSCTRACALHVCPAKASAVSFCRSRAPCSILAHSACGTCFKMETAGRACRRHRGMSAVAFGGLGLTGCKTLSEDPCTEAQIMTQSPSISTAAFSASSLGTPHPRLRGSRHVLMWKFTL